MRKRNEKGQVIKRVPGEYSNKLFGFRVTEAEMQLIKEAKKKGLDPRKVILSEARKVVNIDKGKE